ncbi:MAG: hypothetical protein DRJ61_11585 [Acidobacteria bacterium]|nr:MAG: hypothetical protein DRJ61_11585 [Acidobacteriota bacterium]
MGKNSRIPESITSWIVSFDPYGFSSNENWLEEAEKVEDILQITQTSSDGLILDVGYYEKLYVAFVISNNDWENPVESIESASPIDISNRIYEWIKKYANCERG